MKHLTSIEALPDYRLKLRFDDGVEGVVDLSPEVGKGVFAAWKDVELSMPRTHLCQLPVTNPPRPPRHRRNAVSGDSPGELRWRSGASWHKVNSSERFFQRRNFVRRFPSEVFVALAEVAVVGRLAVNRAEQVQLLDDVRRLEAEHCAHGLLDLLVGDAVHRRAERIDADADRFGMADGVGKLDFRARGDACRDNILRDVTAHVSRAAIHLAWVFAGERAATVTAHAAIAVHDDLAAGQTGVAL